MSSEPKTSAPHQPKAGPKVQLLREVAELVMWELRAVQENRWEDIPTLHVRKQQLLTRMTEFEWKPALRPGNEDPELLLLQAQIVDIEYRIRQRVAAHTEVLKALMADLQKRSRRIKNTVNPYAALAKRGGLP